jgi:hypothetical protein
MKHLHSALCQLLGVPVFPARAASSMMASLVPAKTTACNSNLVLALWNVTLWRREFIAKKKGRRGLNNLSGQ